VLGHRGWLARQERSIGGGVPDLAIFPDVLWREEAVALASEDGQIGQDSGM
jgi:hypothetical protein